MYKQVVGYVQIRRTVCNKRIRCYWRKYELVGVKQRKLSPSRMPHAIDARTSHIWYYGRVSRSGPFVASGENVPPQTAILQNYRWWQGVSARKLVFFNIPSEWADGGYSNARLQNGSRKYSKIGLRRVNIKWYLSPKVYPILKLSIRGNYGKFTCFPHQIPNVHTVFRTRTLDFFTHVPCVRPEAWPLFFLPDKNFMVWAWLFQTILTDKKTRKIKRTLGQVFVRPCAKSHDFPRKNVVEFGRGINCRCITWTRLYSVVKPHTVPN